MHGTDIHAAVRHLAAQGVNDCEIARRLSLPRTTVRDIRAPRRRRTRATVACPRCWRQTRPLAIEPARYAYLLGLYLGDGCIAQLARTYSLRLSLDAKYPDIVAEAREAMACCSPTARVSEHRAGPARTCVVLCVYNQHLPCLFPQHGPGPKHRRRIELESWQTAITREHPWALIRGLMQSDGCRFTNRTGQYAYPSYDFTQVSDDIRRIFLAACAQVGIDHVQVGNRSRIYRRASVALLDERIGPKR